MNTERLLALADKIEEVGDAKTEYDALATETPGFRMRTWRCGSVACVGGWAQIMFASDDGSSDHDLRWLKPEDISRDLLGLTEPQASQLFFPGHMIHIDAAWAARCVRHLAKTGEVDWGATAPSDFDWDTTAEGEPV